MSFFICLSEHLQECSWGPFPTTGSANDLSIYSFHEHYQTPHRERVLVYIPATDTGLCPPCPQALEFIKCHYFMFWSIYEGKCLFSFKTQFWYCCQFRGLRRPVLSDPPLQSWGLVVAVLFCWLLSESKYQRAWEFLFLLLWPHSAFKHKKKTKTKHLIEAWLMYKELCIFNVFIERDEFGDTYPPVKAALRSMP